MLAKKYRLPIQLFVGKRGKVVKTPYFLLKLFPNLTNFSRFGVTVSTKVAKKSVERNKIKRRAFNFLKDKLFSLPSGDYWITILPPAAVLPKEGFMTELKKLFNG